MGKFVMKPTKNGGVKFDLKTAEGEVVVSSQTYKSERTCKVGIGSVMTNAPGAALEDQTVEGYTPQKHPKFELYLDNAGKYRFRLKATNGQIVAISEAFAEKEGCLAEVELVRQNAVNAEILTEE